VPIAGLWLGGDFFADWGTSQLLEAGIFTIPVNLSAEFVYLGVVQLISGIVWAAYELAMLLMFFEAIPKQERASVMTFYNFGNAAAQVIGGLIGAAILQVGHESHVAYLAVFGTSSLVRLCTVPLLRSVNSTPIAQQRTSPRSSIVLRETPDAA
jgi:MFS family permease